MSPNREYVPDFLLTLNTHSLIFACNELENYIICKYMRNIADILANLNINV